MAATTGRDIRRNGFILVDARVPGGECQPCKAWLGVRRELGVGPVQDLTKKGQRLAIHADPVTVATPTQFSNSSNGASNEDPRSDASLHTRLPPQY